MLLLTLEFEKDRRRHVDAVFRYLTRTVLDNSLSSTPRERTGKTRVRNIRNLALYCSSLDGLYAEYVYWVSNQQCSPANDTPDDDTDLKHALSSLLFLFLLSTEILFFSEFVETMILVWIWVEINKHGESLQDVCSFQQVSKSGKQIRNKTKMHQMRLNESVSRCPEYEGIQVKEDETEMQVDASP